MSDAELTRAAQAGDVGSLGVLLARHEAGMRAVALGVLGYGPDTDDVVQDAALVAVSRIRDVRDPAAVGAWLRTVVRNECRMRLRARRPVELGGELISALPSNDPMPEELLDRQLLADWVWHAIEELSPPLRVVAMLRYFSDLSSYEQIAAVCALPIGTVRSRLSQARVKLSGALSATAAQAHEDASAKLEICRQDAVDTLAAADRGAFSELTVRWSPQLELIQAHGDRGGVDLLLTTPANRSATRHAPSARQCSRRWRRGHLGDRVDALARPARRWPVIRCLGDVAGCRRPGAAAADVSPPAASSAGVTRTSNRDDPEMTHQFDRHLRPVASGKFRPRPTAGTIV